MNLPFAAATRRRRFLLPILLLAALCVPSPGAQAAPKYGTSLDWAPADVSFYSSSLRLREQFDIVATSKAWQKLKNIPSVQMAWEMAQIFLRQPGGPVDQMRQFFDEPDNVELRDLIVDGVSNEVVFYGDKSAGDFVDIALGTMNALRYGSMMADIQGLNDEPEDDNQVHARIILNSLDANRERLAAPAFVLGFKVSDAERAKRQLARLKQVLEPIVEDEPKLRGRLKESTIGGVEYLTLELDGSMVPWDEVPWGELEEKPGQYDKLKAKLLTMKAVVCAGVRDGYLLFAVAPSLDPLATLGKGESLAETKELQRLAKFADRRLIGINFVSKSFMQAMNTTGQQMDDLVNVVRQVLPEAGLDEDAEKRLVKDAEALAGDIKGALPEPGTVLSFSFLTDRGVEGYGYNWAENLYYDASKPLPLLDHMGGNPLLAYVARTKYSPDQYQMLRKWVKKAFGYFEEFGVPQMEPDAEEQYRKIKEIAMPLVARIDKATGEMLLPALADGQSGIALDAKITSKRWFKDLRQGDRSLPMLEAALVFGVSDAALLKKAFDEYRAVADEIVEKLKQEQPDEIPADFKLPAAETREVKTGTGEGTIYFYKLPAELGVDAQLTPNAGLSQRVAVLSFAPKQTEQLLADEPLAAGSDSPFSDRSKPLAAALYFNWASTIDVLTPWIDFAVYQIIAAQRFSDDEKMPNDEPAIAADDPEAKMYLDQVHTVLDVLKTLRTVESATYREDDALVTHSCTEFKDVD